jgi:hypothetical protein
LWKERRGGQSLRQLRTAPKQLFASSNGAVCSLINSTPIRVRLALTEGDWICIYIIYFDRF